MSSLPIIQDDRASHRPSASGKRIRRSRSARWRAAVLIGVHLLIAAHIAHWLTAERTVTPVEPSEAMAFVKAGIVNAGLIFFAAAILLTAIFGRFFCGWACHLVALQDLCRWLLEKIGIRPQPLRSRLLLWVPAVAFAYMFLWPLAYRLWIGDPLDRFGVELTTTEFWTTFPGWIVGTLTFLICGFAAVYFLGAKGFCTYACPYGAAFAAAERLSPLRIRVTDACAGCGHCTAVCSSNVRVHEEVRDWGMVTDPGCMKCLDCVSVCPNDALYYGAGPIPLLAPPRGDVPPSRKPALSWPEEIALTAAFLAAFLSFRGLYGAVPFLMSLGLAGILAYLVLRTLQLTTRPHASLRRLRLKRGGRLLPAGYGFLTAMAIVLLFWGHSAFVRYHAFQGERELRRLAPLRVVALGIPEDTAPLAPGDAARARKALAHLEAVYRWGLFPTAGNDSRLAWAAGIAGDSRALRAHGVRSLLGGQDTAAMHQLLARDAWARGNSDVAIAAYERAIAEAPRDPAPYLALGTLLARRGDLSAAAHVFDRGTLNVQGNADLVYNAGLVRALQGDGEGAIEHFEQALALRPGYREARENLAGVLAGFGRFEASVGHYRKAIEQTPGDPTTRVLLGRALIAAGRLEEAKDELLKARDLDLDDPDTAALLAELGRESPSIAPNAPRESAEEKTP